MTAAWWLIAWFLSLLALPGGRFMFVAVAVRAWARTYFGNSLRPTGICTCTRSPPSLDRSELVDGAIKLQHAIPWRGVPTGHVAQPNEPGIPWFLGEHKSVVACRTRYAEAPRKAPRLGLS